MKHFPIKLSGSCEKIVDFRDQRKYKIQNVSRKFGWVAEHFLLWEQKSPGIWRPLEQASQQPHVHHQCLVGAGLITVLKTMLVHGAGLITVLRTMLVHGTGLITVLRTWLVHGADLITVLRTLYNARLSDCNNDHYYNGTISFFPLQDASWTGKVPYNTSCHLLMLNNAYTHTGMFCTLCTHQ